MSERRVFVSCDVDTLDRHLQGYGWPDEPPCDLVYRRAIPRLLDVAEDAGVRLTFFVMGRDAIRERALLAEIERRGHEVASHSWSHPQPFSTLEAAALEYELGASRAALSEACGREVVGFRAPAWDVDGRVLAAIKEAGYRYDASLVPSPAILATRISVYGKGTGKNDALSMNVLVHLRSPAVRHVLGGGASGLVEVPMTVSPVVRFPFYHTMTYLLPRPAWDSIFWTVRRARPEVSYLFHAVDALGLREDGVDERMKRHPGMDRSLDEKLGRLRAILVALAQCYEPACLRDCALSTSASAARQVAVA